MRVLYKFIQPFSLRDAVKITFISDQWRIRFYRLNCIDYKYYTLPQEGI